MIHFDFEYYKPTTIQEAIQIFQKNQKQGKISLFYSGGTEFITFSRMNKISADAVIDIKGIPECRILEACKDEIIIGAGVSLNKITESILFPLLGQTVKQIADHTSRNKITIGGNLGSRLIYREAVLPLLLADARVKIADNEGEKILPFAKAFDKEMKIRPDEFLVQIMIDKEYADQKYYHLKRTKFTKVGYPIVSISALIKDKQIRMAFSGVCEYPFRSIEMEGLFNDDSLPIKERVDHAINRLPSPILEDIEASRNYREFVLKNALQDTLEALKENTL